MSKIGLKLENLDEKTRQLMDEEFKLDQKNKKLYFSPRLSEKGENMYQNLLENAILYGNDTTLATELKTEDAIKVKEKRMMAMGGVILVDVPKNANEALAEGEFNRYYIRAMCRKAIDTGIKKLQIYNANPERETPAEYKQLIGKHLDPKELLNDLRNHSYVDGTSGIPVPQTGLTVKFG
ncbi:hypothetical protein [Candidatus Lokiarchaeum ossiferum]|uniref:hypothetical protein n=1 Tax=Candidatus Lokiarchaeum ossiferum TaxID=2951803 RepID=UPI00352D5A1B